MQYLNFQSASVHVQNMDDIGKASITLGDNPANWQASFISPTYYPPGTNIEILNLSFTITTVSKQTSNIYQYSAYLKASLESMGAMGKIDNTGAYERIPGTNPYNWSRLGDLTAAIQNTMRNRSQNTLMTPFEKSFDRFESSMNWASDSTRDALSNLYINSQALVIPWYNNNGTIDWISLEDWTNQPPINVDDITITTINTIGKPKGVKIYAKNRYKRAVTMYECPVLINPSNDLLDVGFYVMACDGDTAPTVRFTYNYNLGFNFTTRITTHSSDTFSEWTDDSGMATIVAEELSENVTEMDVKYWYEFIKFFDTNTDGAAISADSLNELTQQYLKALVFVANPIITFNSEEDYMDSYFPYPIAPWNFQVYLKPTNTGKWIPTDNPYPIYDLNLLSNLPPKIWTGAFCSVTRLSTLQQSDESMNKEITQQGFYINGFNTGNTVNPHSLLTFENQTQMPILADNVVNEYLTDLTMPSIPYKVYMVSGLQKSLYQYGITIEQVTDNEDTYPSKTLTLNLSNMSLNIDDDVINYERQSYEHVDVIVCYKEAEQANGTRQVQLNDDFTIGVIKIHPPNVTQRMEKCIILLFSTAIYFITYRIFTSPAFLCAPYVYKFDEEYDQTLSPDYDIINVDNYGNLMSKVGKLIDKSITFEWEGKVSEFPELLPFRFINGYTISNVNITIEGDYIKATCTADNRLRIYQKWNKMLTDVVPHRCATELYPRIPNRHHPISKIYAFSDREQKLQEYLNKVFEYTYTDQGDGDSGSNTNS